MTDTTPRTLLPSAALLFARPDFDVSAFAALYGQHWGVTPEFASEDENRFAATLSECLVVVEKGVRPFDVEDLLMACGNSADDMKEAFAQASAYVRVTVAAPEGPGNARRAAVLLLTLTASLATLEGAQAIACARRLVAPAHWLERAALLGQNRVPADLLVHAGVWEAGEGRYAAFTSGLDAFGSPEIEIRPSQATPEACAALLMRLAGYTIETGKTLKSGDSVATGDNRAATLTLENGIVLEGEKTLQFELV